MEEFTPQQKLAWYVATETALCARTMMRAITNSKWHEAWFYANRITGMFNGLHADLELEPRQSSAAFVQDMADFAFNQGEAVCRINISNAYRVAHQFCDAYRSGLKMELFKEGSLGSCYFNFKPSTTEVVL